MSTDLNKTLGNMEPKCTGNSTRSPQPTKGLGIINKT